ncbi:acyltransferase [Candidatus Merdisoma sp. JLR.KK006]|uniref:acyltransferase n=1 Tax=Candidatus Merdisoma sp. JLR.KK006 TaxID=3112626 RepID=UPI002FF159F4
MTTKHFYPAIDRFKLLAAILVIAIHTSPFTSLSPEADYIFARILARIAVPFFFMVTGYFVLPKALASGAYACSYLKRIGLIYLISMVIYLPVGIYAGHFKGAGIVSVLKMILLDGTFYHLWYLPALILGFGLIVLLLRALPVPAVGVICGLFYLAGLFGDSYFGFLPEGSFVYTIYMGLFHVFEYTRNGLFYTPVFLLLGYLMTEHRPSFALSLGALGGSFGFLLGEGILLKLLDTQRHDSMYFFLIPVMYFLFSALLEDSTEEQQQAMPKDLPLLIYLLHPLFIILVRGGAKITRLSVFVDNSLAHFLAVTISTFAGAWILIKLLSLLPKKNDSGVKTKAGKRKPKTHQKLSDSAFDEEA